MFDPQHYQMVITLFPRLLGFIYFCAFGALLFQIKGLIGKNGILPLVDYLQLIRNRIPKRFLRSVPTLFWLNASDRALYSVVGLGTLLSIVLMLGFVPTLMLFCLYILYLSIVWAGQDFLSFGWEGFLLEITINAFFLSLVFTPNLFIWISLNLVLFRFHFQGGVVKLLSRDPNWRNLTAVAYHYQSQPIPNAVAWYVHKWPLWFHKLSTLLMFIIELIVPFGIFGTESVRFWVFLSFFFLQWTIWITGNFSYLNHLTVVLSSILIGNHYLAPWITIDSSPSLLSGTELNLICSIVGIILITFQLIQLYEQFFPNAFFEYYLRKINPFHIANRYGIFAVMTTTRYEVVFEGSNDGILWKEYTFSYKPSNIFDRPKRISPYQPRIDWQAWFLPLGSYRYDIWLDNFIYHLLKGTRSVLKLLKDNPFHETPPRYIRSVLYEYTFSSAAEKKAEGIWWNRKFIDIFTHPVSLKQTLET